MVRIAENLLIACRTKCFTRRKYISREMTKSLYNLIIYLMIDKKKNSTRIPDDGQKA